MATKESKVLVESDASGRAAREPARSEVNILCLDLSGASAPVQFACACTAVFIIYIAYGYYLELIFSSKDVKDVSLYITLVQFLLTVTFSYAESAIRRNTKRKAPLKMYALLGALTLGTMVFSNLALSYLNYPTQLIFKSCKLVPVMVGSILIQGRRYAFLDYLAAVVMCVGLTMFTLADSKTSPDFDVKGVVIISAALVCDAVIGNVQEKVMRQHYASNNEVVFYSYGLASVYLMLYTAASGTLLHGYTYCLQSGYMMYWNIVMLSVCGYTGLQAVLTLVRVCGAPVTVTVTTMRKALSIVFSFLLFHKAFVFQYLWSGALVMAAIYLNMLSKRHPDYTPPLINKCRSFLLHSYKSEYRMLRSRSRYYADV